MGLAIGVSLTVILTLIYRVEHGVKDATQTEAQIEIAPKAAPLFALKDAEGRERTLEEFRGKPLILHFWASWCPPCIDEIPQLVALAKRFNGKPLTVLMVNLDAKWADAHKILPSKGLPASMVSIMDPASKVPDEYGSYQFPESYLLNAKLEVVTKWVGPQKWESPEVLSAIQKVLP
ncbi:MAG: TlpA family protein disulfide reductase [Oligoflexia bacterium]|nr:TlpA family protein disulfide reductase [Oligoflexia bacterium]